MWGTLTTHRKRVAAAIPTPVPLVDDPFAGAHHEKPRHRGRLHQVAFFASVPLGFALVLVAARPASHRLAAAVYVASLSGLFFTSALYNRYMGTSSLRPWMRWVDHAMIYVLIAGSYTPVTWVALPREWSVPILAVVWTTALTGVVMKLTALKRFRRVGGTLYMALGWFALVSLPKLLPSLSGAAIGFLAAGGACYTLGAVLLWLRRPNFHADFGYHEVWHALVVAGAACHFAMTWLTLAHPAT